jgi:CHAT domain-containing protein
VQALKLKPAHLSGKQEARAEQTFRRRLEVLAQLILRPLAEHIDRAEQWIISPDASLWMVPWAALPLANGRYAIEKHQISYVVSGRDLVFQGAGAPRSPKVKPSAPLLMADPDFDDMEIPRPQRGEVFLTRGLPSGHKLPRFARLPGTAAEAKAIAPLLERYAAFKPAVHIGKQALESVFKVARGPRVVVLSTHGFFLEDQEDAAPPAGGGLERGLKLVSVNKADPNDKAVKVFENPLLRCGLALAGANQRDKATEGADDGILTGLEIVGTDLRGTELVVLSACETGLGQVRNGEGVAGLRQAFQLAGAQSVVATLWQIPDKETTALMTAFFENLAAKKGKAEALRLAQLKIIKERRAKHKAAHPFYWAAFTLTGKGHQGQGK